MLKPQKAWVFYWAGAGDYPQLKGSFRDKVKYVMRTSFSESKVTETLLALYRAFSLNQEELCYTAKLGNFKPPIGVQSNWISVGNNPTLQARRGTLYFDKDDLIDYFEPIK
jgi:hypothetical protein